MKKLFTFLIIIIGIGIVNAQWSSSNGPWKGSVTCFTSLGDKIFAGSAAEGIYYSTNSGLRWHASSMVGLTNNEIKCFLWSGDNLFAGTSGGVYISTDFGENWYAINTGLSGEVHSLLIYDNAIIAGTGWGVYKTTDTGASWSPISNNIGNMKTLIIDGDTFFAGTTQGVFKSTDGGSNWSSANVGLINQNVNVLYKVGNVLYAGTGYSQGAASLYRTSNSGASWLASGLINRSVNALSFFQSNIYAGCNNGVYRSTDLGITWGGELGETHKEFTSFFPFGTNLLAGSTSGLFLSSNGGTVWDQVGYKSFWVQEITSHGNELWASGSHDMVYYSSNNGNSWIKRDTWLSSAYRYTNIAANDTIAYVSYINNNLSRTGIYYTTDKGIEWNQSMQFENKGSIQCLEEYANILFMGMYRKEGQYGMFCLNAPFYSYQFYNQGVFNVKGSGNYLYADASNGLYKSTDSGTTWVNKGITGGKIAVYGSDVYVAADKIYYSSDNGENWIERGLEGKIISCIAAENNFIITGVYNEGYYISTDKGINWQLRNDGFEGVPVNPTDIHIANGVIFTAVGEQSVWKRTLVNITGVESVSEELPVKMELLQNYPNPFNPATVIKYNIALEGEVSIEVFNVLGERVAVLINEYKYPGTYEVVWNSNDLAGGIYFYRLRQQEMQLTKKMVLLR